MLKNKLYIDTRTNEIVEQIPIQDIGHFEEFEGLAKVGEFACRACGREESACSAIPCRAVQEQRAEDTEIGDLFADDGERACGHGPDGGAVEDCGQCEPEPKPMAGRFAELKACDINRALYVYLWTAEAVDSRDEHGHNQDGHVLRITAPDIGQARALLALLNNAEEVDLA